MHRRIQKMKANMLPGYPTVYQRIGTYFLICVTRTYPSSDGTSIITLAFVADKLYNSSMVIDSRPTTGE